MKVNDRVHVVADNSIFKGCVGKIVEIDSTFVFSIKVKFDKAHKVVGIPYKDMIFESSELELI